MATAVAPMPDTRNMVTIPFWIDGKPAVSVGPRAGEVTNAATGEVIRTVSFATAADIDAAVNAASAAFPGWRATTALRRARILSRFRELTSSITRRSRR